MATEHYKLFINGKFVDTSDHYQVRYPYNEEVVGVVAQASAAEVEDAIAAAVQAFGQTRVSSRARRAEILLSMSRGLAERRSELERAITLCTGKPIASSRGEVSRAIGVLAYAAEETKRFGGRYEPLDFDPLHSGAVGMVERFPIGPIAAIAPFNSPLSRVIHKVAPALATGNTIVVKPPPQCPAPALVLAELAFQAGAPPGALNVVSADPPVAEQLVIDERIRMLTFTGSAVVGWALKQKSGTKKVTLELGGNGALIIDESADCALAAARAAHGAFINAGQVCIHVQRIFVHRAVYKDFLARFIDATGKLAVGDPASEQTFVGPMISRAAAERLMEWIADAREAGAAILTGNQRDGALVQPTIIELGDRDLRRLRVWREEVFGPVVTIERVDSLDEAIEATNDSLYGLQAGLFTARLDHAFRAFRGIEAGAVIVGDTGMFSVDSYPFGGVKNSGVGREGVRWAMESMTEPRMLVLNLERPRSPVT